MKITYARIMFMIAVAFLLWLLWTAYSDEQRAIKFYLTNLNAKADLAATSLAKLQEENAKFNTQEISDLHDISQQVRSNANVLQELQQDIETQSPSPSLTSTEHK